MSEERIHRTISDDGTEIAGRVHGQGPALVFVHGIIADGDLDWTPLVRRLADRFTCYLPSTRGRGASGHSDDHARPRLVQDVVAFATSIGDPVGIVGFSSGGALAIAAATQTETITAAAAYEPAFTALLDERSREDFRAGVMGAAEAVKAGRLSDGARSFAQVVCTHDELAALEASDYLEEASRCAPAMVQDIIQGQQSNGPVISDPAVLAHVRVPLLLLHGPGTAMRWFTDNVRHAAEHVADAQTREIPGAGHLAPLLHPEPVADEAARFFATAHQPAPSRQGPGLAAQLDQ